MHNLFLRASCHRLATIVGKPPTNSRARRALLRESARCLRRALSELLVTSVCHRHLCKELYHSRLSQALSLPSARSGSDRNLPAQVSRALPRSTLPWLQQDYKSQKSFCDEQCCIASLYSSYGASVLGRPPSVFMVLIGFRDYELSDVAPNTTAIIQ